VLDDRSVDDPLFTRIGADAERVAVRFIDRFAFTVGDVEQSERQRTAQPARFPHPGIERVTVAERNRGAVQHDAGR